MPVRMTGMKGTEVGKYLTIGPPSVSRAVRRGEWILQENHPLQNKLESRLFR